MPPYAPSPLPPSLVSRIVEALGAECVLTRLDSLEAHAQDGTSNRRVPDLVVEATSSAQVQTLMGLANEYRIPVTPRGLGTGLAGGAVPRYGGVVLSLARMNRILAIDRENLIARVEPGVINLDLKKAAQAAGLFYPPDPASLDTCSVGGNAATNAGGPACLKYGTTRDYVLGLEVVLPTGELIHTGVQTRKGVVGYDLTRLLVGSEGTLGIITQLVLKLISHPAAVTTLVALFPDLVQAMRAVTSILVQGHLPSALEFMDHHCLDLVADLLPFQGLDRLGALLLVETDGIPDLIQREIEKMGMICLREGAADVLLAPDANKRAQMWQVRRELSLRIERSAPVYIPEDVVVPIGRIAELVDGLPEIEARYGLRIYSFGHAGDGNIHLNITADDGQNENIIEEGLRKILQRVIALGGTLSGEHGIGVEKMRFLPLELSPESLELQAGIKRLIDPRLVLNPGKIFHMSPEE